MEKDLKREYGVRTGQKQTKELDWGIWGKNQILRVNGQPKRLLKHLQKNVPSVHN